MKCLTIVRHAKSSWDFPDLSDRERPLNKRGNRDAPVMGKRMLEAGIVPTKIVSSVAVRAWDTAGIIAEIISYPADNLIPDQRLYHASVGEMLTVISELGEGSEHLMIVGHNPGLTDLVNYFHPGLTYNLPTTGVVTFRIDSPDWDIANSTGTELIYHDYADISIAISTPTGLVVPPVHNVESLSFAEIEYKIKELAGKARNGTLTLDEMSGGTFTITNGGIFGSLLSTPILNEPQSAILGMHGIQQRPVAIDGKMEIRPMMYVALSYDHRVIDGSSSVTFLVRVKKLLEDPGLLLLDL